MVTDVVVADLDGDGSGETVVGGRGVGVIDEDSITTGRYRWTNKWIEPDGTRGEGDWDFAREMQVVDVTGDGRNDVVVGADNGLYVMDALTGESVWTWFDHRDDPQGGHAPQSDGANDIAVADLNGDGTKDVIFADLFDDGVTAVDVKNERLLWFFGRRNGITMDVHAADLNGDGGSDVVVTGGARDLAEIEVTAISGAGVHLWSQPYLGPGLLDGGGLKGDPVVIETGQVLAGLTTQVVIGGGNGQVSVFDAATGNPQRVWATPRPVVDLVLAEIDGDAQKEIVATATDRSREPEGGSVVAYDGAGALLWSQTAAGPPFDLEVGNPDGVSGNELIVGGGFHTPDGRSEQDGFVQLMELGIATTQRVRWTKLVTEHVKSVDHGQVNGEPTIVAGQNLEGDVIALSPTGAERWLYRTGGRIEQLTTADLDGSGLPEIVEVADDSAVSVHDATGNLLWTKRVPGIGGPDVINVGTANLDAEASDEIVVGTWDFNRDDAIGGRLHAYDADGSSLWSVDQPGAIHSLRLADIDGDGQTDVLSGTAIGGQVGRYDAAGQPVWEKDLDTGTSVELALVEITNDGVEDVIAGTKRFGPLGDLYALDGSSGELIWHRDGDPGVPGESDGPIVYGVNWISVDGDRVVLGDLVGRVYPIDPATGEPSAWLAHPGGSSWNGGWTIDANGDGVRDVVSVSQDDATRIFSGADGSELWKTDTPESDHDSGFRVTTVDYEGQAVIATGTFGSGVSNVQMLDARTGEQLSVTPLHSYVIDIISADLSGEGVPEILVAAGWNLHALRSPLIAPTESPTPGPTETTSPSPSPSHSPPVGTTTVTFTENSAAAGQYSDKSRFEARLTNSGGDPIRGAELVFELRGDGSSRSFTATTKGDGIAWVTPVLEEQPGPYQVTVHYGGDDTYLASADTHSFVVDKEDTTLELIVQGKNNTLRARLSDADKGSSWIARRAIDFYADEEFIGSATTDEKGVANLKLPPRFRGGNHNFEARFDGDDYYAGSVAAE